MIEKVSRSNVIQAETGKTRKSTKQSTALAEYDEPLIRRLIEKVTIYEGKFTVEFKSGMTVDVNE